MIKPVLRNRQIYFDVPMFQSLLDIISINNHISYKDKDYDQLEKHASNTKVHILTENMQMLLFI